MNDKFTYNYIGWVVAAIILYYLLKAIIPFLIAGVVILILCRIYMKR